MKKLMFMLGVAAMAVGVQAASFNWGTDTKAWGLPASDLAAGLTAGTTYNVGSANADTMSNQLTSYNATWAYALTFSYDDGNSVTTDTLTGNLGSGAFSSRKVNLDLSSDLVVAGRDLTYSLVFTGTVKDGQNATFDVTSNEITGSWHVNDMGDISLQTHAPSTWTAAPEPTSGILMLVGLGALALRRRKA